MDQDANRLDDFPDALGDDEILILDYDLDDAGDEEVGGLYDDSAEPAVLTDAGDAELVVDNPRTMVVEEPRSGKWALIAVPFLLLLIGGGVWFQFFRESGGDKPQPTRRTASNKKRPQPTKKPAKPENRSPSVASVVNAGREGSETDSTTSPETSDDTSTDTAAAGGANETETANDASTNAGHTGTTETDATSAGSGTEPTTAQGAGPAGTPTAQNPEPNAGTTETAARSDGPAAFGELMTMTLLSGFARLKTASDSVGVQVRLKDGRVIKLARGESLVQLKNGNYFKGNIAAVNDKFLTVALAFGKMKIPQSDLNQIVDPGASDYLPLKAFKTGVLHLKNGNRLTGKIMKVTTDRVILGFPSAKIVVSRAALKNGLNSIEYTEEGTRKRIYGVSSTTAALGLRPGQGVETLLGVPYYDFEYGFRIVPPKHWTKFSKDAIVGFQSTPISAITGCLTLGGLFLSTDELSEAIRQVPQNIEIMPGTKLLGDVRDVRNKSLPWSWEFDCAVEQPSASTDGATKSKRCRTYIFSKGKKAFILSIFSPEEKFELVSNVLAMSAKSFEFRN